MASIILKWMQDEKGNEYLFDLESDPSESIDVKEQHKELFDKLKKKYQQWEATVLTTIPVGG